MLSPAIRRFLNDDEGLETVEYAVMAGLIVGALFVSIFGLSRVVIDTVGGTTSQISGI